MGGGHCPAMKPFGAVADPSGSDSRRLSSPFVASRPGATARRGEVPGVIKTALAHTLPAEDPHHAPMDRWSLAGVIAARAVEAPGLSKECGNGRQEEERTRMGGRWFGMVVCAVLAYHGRLTTPVSAERAWKVGRAELVAPRTRLTATERP